MTKLHLIPQVSIADWVQLWQKCYSNNYNEAEYLDCMHQAAEAQDEESVRKALRRIFKWKEPMESRWRDKIGRVEHSDWLRWKEGTELPALFSHGIVYDAFIAHVASGRRRPIIDQHVWRAYCYMSKRANFCELPTYKKTAVSCFVEYESWFNVLRNGGIDSRSLDKALMAFGQFCSSQFRAFADFCYSQPGACESPTRMEAAHA